MTELAAQQCIPCRGDVPPLTAAEIEPLHAQLEAGWNVLDGHHLSKTFTFGNFRQALAFVNRVGEMAEDQAHHPDIALAWGRVQIDIWTHKIDGLTASDFIFAARAQTLFDDP
jgi:4a-hydroxytetrahydrobiopterin dehydratase